MALTYSAVGKGLYTLSVPPGQILDAFKIALTANGSDVRMLELSLQPTNLERLPGQTRYVWDYQRLLYGRPIALDVLGIAPIDRLGELSWLGPVSVIVFGLLIGLVSRARASNLSSTRCNRAFIARTSAMIWLRLTSPSGNCCVSSSLIQ